MSGRSKLVWAGSVLIAGLLTGAAWWVLQPSYVALHKGASEADQAQILATLSQWQLPYRINAAEGLIEVPTERLADARMRMIEAGIPNQTRIGFEIFDQADYGMSEFSQKINYQRALEGELARTLMSIVEVQSARVHLTLRKTSLYRQQDEKPKASVIVRLRSGDALDASRVRGIQKLVASAVEGMEQEHVVVLDENGHLLSLGDIVQAVPEQLQMSEQLENELQHKAELLLAGPLGEDGAKVSVRVQLNFDRIKSIKELPLRPQGKDTVQREKKVTSSESSSGDSNSKRSQTTSESDFALGKERAEIEHATGKIERISVGVVLAKALPADGIQELRQLLEAAMGLDASRGDQMVIAHIPSSADAVPHAHANTWVTAVETAPDADMDAAEGDQGPWSWLGLSLPLLVALAVLALALLLVPLGLYRALGVRAAQPPRLTVVEREQLLLEMRHWLQEGRSAP